MPSLVWRGQPSAQARMGQCMSSRSQGRKASMRTIPYAQPKVVCLGEALFDMLANDKGVPKEEVSSWSGYPGGAPCNVACGLGQLGIPVAFVSALGEDERGNELVELMKSRGVDVTAVERVPQPTRDVYVVRTHEGDRIFDSFGQHTSTYCDCFINAERLPEEVIAGAQVLVTGTLGLAYPTTAETMYRAVELAKAAKTTVLVDVNWRPVFFEEPSTALETIMPLVQKAEIVKITDEEVEWAFGVPAAEALDDPCKVLDQLPNARGVLVTGGGEGAAYCFQGPKQRHSGKVPVFKVDVQDTTGAGDAFTCGFLAYLLAENTHMDELLSEDADTHKAVKFAAACGALTTLKSGAIAAQPTLDSIREMVATAEA